MKRIIAVLALCVAFSGVALLGQRPQNPGATPAPGVGADARFADDEILIQFHADAADADKSDARGWVNAQRRQLIRRGAAGELERAGLAVGMPVDVAVALLNRHPAVAFAEPNWIYGHQATSDDPYYTSGSLWGMYGGTTEPANVFGSQAAKAWASGHVGSRAVVVAVIDEGIAWAHEDLGANVWTNPYDPPGGGDNDGNGYIDDIHGWDFYQNNNTIYDGSSGSGVDAHGTHVSGTIGALAGNGKGVAGVNWNVSIISAKFLGPSGGTTANAVKAVDYVTNLKKLHPDLNIVATNNSWGGGGYSQALHDAIIRAAKTGILFVAAAGNSGRNNNTTASYPSNYNTSTGTTTESAAGYDAVIAVAAIDSSGGRPSWSNYGSTTVDLGAPGADIWSTTPGGYSSYDGTSMATPHVTGAAALYASMNAGASAAAIKAALLNSAVNTPTASLGGRTVTGGRLNIALLLPATPAPLTIACPANQTATSPNGSAVAVNYPAPTTTGGVDPVVSSTPASGSLFAVGTTTVAANASSSDGQTANCSFTVTVTYSPPPANSFTLAATGFKTKGVQSARLNWSGAPTARVNVYRNEIVIGWSDTGTYTDNIGKKGPGTYVYKVCDTPTSCSNSSTVVF